MINNLIEAAPVFYKMGVWAGGIVLCAIGAVMLWGYLESRGEK